MALNKRPTVYCNNFIFSTKYYCIMCRVGCLFWLLIDHKCNAYEVVLVLLFCVFFSFLMLFSFLLFFSPVLFLGVCPALIGHATSVRSDRWWGAPPSFKKRMMSNTRFWAWESIICVVHLVVLCHRILIVRLVKVVRTIERLTVLSLMFFFLPPSLCVTDHLCDLISLVHEQCRGKFF